jgi:hypothetical protein
MTGRGVAAVTIAALFAAVGSRGAIAQPKDAGAPDEDEDEDEIEIEMVPDPSGSGAGSAAGNASATGSARALLAAPTKDPRLARKWLAAAQQLMQRGSYLAARNRPDAARSQFENAVTAYHKAIEVADDPNLYFDLANAEDKLGKPCDAVKHLRLVIRTNAGVRPEVIKKATARLDDLAARVGVVTLIVKPAGASVTLGGTELGTAPLGEPLVLLPGTYALSFQAEGFQPREAEIQIEAGTEVERAIELERVKLIIAPVAPVAPIAPIRDAGWQDDRESPQKLPLYLGAAVTGAAVINATIFGVLALRQHATFTAGSTAKLDREDARTNGTRFALVSDVSLGAAVIAAGFTATWYFTRYQESRKLSRSPRPPRSDGRRPPTVETKLDVVPWVQPQSGGAAIAGWF